MRLSQLWLLLMLALVSFRPLAAQVTIASGQSVSGQLQSSDLMMSDGSYYDEYVITARAGDELVMTLRSSDFDAYLQWGTGQGTNFSAENSNDDGGGGTDSELTVVVGSPGTWTIRANSLYPEQTGAYTLEVRGSSSGSVAGGGGTPTIAAGQTINSRLDSDDHLLADNSHFEDFVYNGQAGDAIVITMRSDDFDAFLQWGNGVHTEFVPTSIDDDSGGGTDAELRVVVGDTGPHGIRANSIFGVETGNYTLSVARADLADQGGATGRGGLLGTNQSIHGRLEYADPTLPDGSHYDTYTYQGRPGEDILITMTSNDFDAYLRGGRSGPGGAFEYIESDDDGAGGTNARLQTRVPEGGIYVVQANSYSGGQTGEYTISVQTVASAASGSTASIRAGQSINGQLTSSDPRLSDNSYYHLYQYQGQPGEELIVTMRSTDVDAYLSGGRLIGESLNVDISNDDGAGGTDARLHATVGPTGVFGIRVNTLRAGETGRYTLSVESAGGGLTATVPLPAGAASVAVGQTIRGTLTTGDRRLSDDSLFDEYIIQGQPGEQVQIALSSSDFDSYLYWGRLAGDNFITQTTNDDDGGGTDALLLVTIGADGLYAVRANAYYPNTTGNYTLTVTAVNAPILVDEAQTGSLGKWLYAYDTAPPALRSAATRMKESQAFETLVTGLNSRYTLPRPLTISGTECGYANAYYSPRDEAITFCYELYDMLGSIFVDDGQWSVEQQEAVDGAVNFILMHEVGHAFVDLFDLPITGREEDAVDQLATMVLIDGGDKGAMAALNGVMALQPAEDQFDQSDFADEHSLGPVRMFNVICWIFGSNPTKYGGLVEGGHLPQERAVRCPSEYEQLSKSWRRLLQETNSFFW